MHQRLYVYPDPTSDSSLRGQGASLFVWSFFPRFFAGIHGLSVSVSCLRIMINAGVGQHIFLHQIVLRTHDNLFIIEPKLHGCKTHAQFSLLKRAVRQVLAKGKREVKMATETETEAECCDRLELFLMGFRCVLLIVVMMMMVVVVMMMLMMQHGKWLMRLHTSSELIYRDAAAAAALMCCCRNCLSNAPQQEKSSGSKSSPHFHPPDSIPANPLGYIPGLDFLSNWLLCVC